MRMQRSPHRQQASVSLLSRTLFFLLVLLLLFLFLVIRVIPCILCDLYELCKPGLGLANPAPARGFLRAPREAAVQQRPLPYALRDKSRTYTY